MTRHWVTQDETLDDETVCEIPLRLLKQEAMTLDIENVTCPICLEQYEILQGE